MNTSPNGSTIEDKLKEILNGYHCEACRLHDAKATAPIKRIQAIITTETYKASQIAYELGKAEAKLDEQVVKDYAASLQKEQK